MAPTPVRRERERRCADCALIALPRRCVAAAAGDVEEHLLQRLAAVARSAPRGVSSSLDAARASA